MYWNYSQTRPYCHWNWLRCGVIGYSDSCETNDEIEGVCDRYKSEISCEGNSNCNWDLGISLNIGISERICKRYEKNIDFIGCVSHGCTWTDSVTTSTTHECSNLSSQSSCNSKSSCNWNSGSNATQSRTVICVSSTGATVDSNCPGSKPSVSKSCTPVGTWQTTPAASCSTACGQSATTKYRTVTCSGENCNQSTKPSRPSRYCSATSRCPHPNYGKRCTPMCLGNQYPISGTYNFYGRCVGDRCIYLSFIAGTKITMADGTLKNIELLKKGDKVISSGGETVVEKIHKYSTEEAVYSLNGSRYFVTGSHPFMTLGGWKSFHPENTRRKVPEIKVSQLKIGDTLLRENGESELLEKFDSINGTHEVYNLRVKGSHDFYADGYWVHNK